MSGTYYRIGRGALKRYKKAFKVKSGKKPVKVSFYLFGVAEKTKKIRLGSK